MKVILFSNDVTFTDRYKHLLMNFSYEIIKDYNQLCVEAQKRNLIIIMDIDECKDELSMFLDPLIEQYAYLIILDSYPTYEKGKKLISVGIRAYGNLMMDDIHLKEVINSVMDGNIWLYPEFINETVSRMRYEANPHTIELKLDILTNRERDVALLVIEKLSYQEISEKLDISLRTVKAHTKNIYEKFNVSNRLAFLLLFNH